MNLDNATYSSLTEITEVEGKKLSKSHLKLLARIQSAYVGTCFYLNKTAWKRDNPYSGARVALSPLAVSFYDFIIDGYNAGFVGRTIRQTDWNNARYFFLAYWPDEYYKLID